MIKKFALFLIALLPVGLMAQDVKLGHVNSQEILSIMPERTEIEKKLNALQDDVEKELVKMREEYNAKVKEFVDKQATMPETIKQARQSEIVEMEQRINTFSQTAQSDLSKQYQDLTAPMIEKVKKAIGEVAAEGGYTYIFDLVSQTIVYQSPKSNDITPIVKKKLGLTNIKPATTETPAATTPKK
ncbi:MAG: OmpH family outer membrane protein [Paludibacteraceae bacterium]